MALLHKPIVKGLFHNIIIQMNKPTPKIYRTLNWSTYNRALINRGNMPFGLIQKLSGMHKQRANKVEIKLILM